ncbi:MAG: hypothetical protein LBG18_07610 [Mediterranea sp.]|jgi:hypothetical protein|nr:hypothetical protein [Mediterranea sp.]
MPVTSKKVEKQKDILIDSIRTNIREEKEVETLTIMINKLVSRREAREKKALQIKLKKIQESYLKKTRVSSIISLQSENNVTNEEALQEIAKIIKS